MKRSPSQYLCKKTSKGFLMKMRRWPKITDFREMCARGHEITDSIAYIGPTRTVRQSKL